MAQSGFNGAVYSHDTRGDTTRNPNLCIDRPGREQKKPFTRQSKLWRKWQQWLRKDANRFRFPWLSEADIRHELDPDYTLTANISERVKNHY